MTNPPFTVTDCYADPDLNTTNNDLNFSLVLETERYRFHYFVPFEDLREFAKQYRKEDANYFDRLRSNIPGIGPKMLVMYRDWLGDGYDIVPLVHSWVEATVDIAAEIEHQLTNGWKTLVDKTSPEYEASLKEEDEEDGEDKNEEPMSNPHQEWLEKMVDPLEAMNEENRRMETFQDALLEQANRLALEVWPELMEREPDTIREMGNILVTHVMDMAEDLAQLAYEGE